MSVFTSKLSKLSDFQRAQPGEQPITIDPALVDFLEQDRSAENPGLSEESLRELGASMKADGQLMPAIVRPNPDKPGRYIMVAGERRCRAALLSGLKLLVFVRSLTEAQHRSIQRAENIQREGLTQLETANALRRDKAALGTLAAVAEAWHKSISWVSERIAFGEAVAAGGVAAAAVQEGLTADVSTVTTLAKLEKVDPEAARVVLDNATPDTNLRHASRAALDAAKEKKGSKRQRDDSPLTPENVQTISPNSEDPFTLAKKWRPQRPDEAASQVSSLPNWLDALSGTEPLTLVATSAGWVLHSSSDQFSESFSSLDSLIDQLARLAATTGKTYYSSLLIDMTAMTT